MFITERKALLKLVILGWSMLVSSQSFAVLSFTSSNPADGPSTWATSVCFANGSLDATQYCGPTGYPAGEAGSFLFAGKTSSGGNVTSVAPSGGNLYVTAGASNSTTIVDTRHIAALNYLSGSPTVYLSGLTIYQTSGSNKTVTIQTFSNTDAYSHTYGAVNANITSTTTYVIPSGVRTVVPVSTVSFKSFWVGFPSSTVFGINDIQLGTTDTTAPRISSITRQSPTVSPTASDTVTWRITFNEGVQNVNAADFTISGTTATLSVSTVSTTTYDVTASGGDLANLNDTITLGISGSHDIEDLASTPNSLVNTTPTGTNDNTFVILNDTTSPTIQILNAPASLTTRAPFSVTFEFSEDVTGFTVGDVTVGNGTISNFVTVDGNTYTADITPSGAGNVTIDVAAGVAQDDASNPNTAATQILVICGAGCGEIATITQTKKMLKTFSGRAIRHITSQGPGISGFLSRDGMGGSINGLFNTPFALNFTGDENNNSGNFSTSLQQFANFKISLNADGNKPDIENTSPSPANVWIKGRWSKINDDRGNIDDETDFGIIYLGADYRFSDDLLIGVLAQYDWFDETATGLNMKGEGKGWMIGPYLVTRLKDSLTMDLRVAWGQSNNKINPLGTYWDDFDGERWQIEGNLTGSFKEGDWHISPEFGLNYFKDIQKSYVDNNGFTIPKQSNELGTLSFGPKFIYMANGYDGSKFHPFVTIKGVWDFKAPEIYDVNGLASGAEELRGQVGFGVDLQTSQGTSIQANYMYDGIGIDDYESHTADLSAVISLESQGMPKGSRLRASYSLQNVLLRQSHNSQGVKIELSIPFN
ncbi:MAG: autotransporter domain-containing protein [Sedimenticola sp.]